MAGSEDGPALDEIDENLKRGELSDAERAQHHAERKAIYERRYPETRVGASGGTNRGKRRNEVAKVAATVERYTVAAARVVGASERSVRRDARRGNRLREHLTKIRGTTLDKGQELDALAELMTHTADDGPAVVADLVARAAAAEVAAQLLEDHKRRIEGIRAEIEAR